jgi:hypothetical protein
VSARRAIHHSHHVQGITALALGLVVLAGVALYAHAHFQGLPPAGETSPSQTQHIAGWMTVRYISRTYDVPESLLLQALGINARQARFRSLASIARLQHTTTDHELAVVRAAIHAYRHPATPTPAPSQSGGSPQPP